MTTPAPTSATATAPSASAKTPWLLLFALTAIAALLRAPLLDRPVWFDEACMSDQRIGTTAQWLATLYVDIHPPLFVSFMHFWNGWFGDGEVAMRTPALLSGLLSVPLTWWVGSRLVGGRAALIAAALLALSPVHAWYCAEARLYAPMVLCTLLAFGCVDRLTDEACAHRRLLFWLHAANVAVMLALHYYLSVYVAVLTALAPVLRRGGGPRVRGLLWLHGAGLALLSGFLLVKIKLGQFETSQGYLTALDGEKLFDFVFSWAWTGDTLQATANPALESLGVGFVWLGVGLVTLGTGAVLARAPRRPRGLLVPIGVLTLPLFLLACALVGLDRTFLERTMIAALPFVFLLAAAGLEVLPGLAQRAATGATLAVAAAALAALYATYDSAWTLYKPHPDWRSAAAYLGSEIDAGHAGAPVFTSMPNPRSLSYYDARIQDAKNLEVQVQPSDISAKLAPLVGEGFAETARALFEDFAANNRKLLADAAMVVQRCRPRPDQLELPPSYDGPCYVVRNHWHPHVTVDDSVEALLADPQVEVLHTASWNGVTISKVRIGK